MNKLHLVYTPFTGVGLHNGYRGDEWYKYRIELFKQTLLPSLRQQTNQNFIHWLSFRKEEKENPLTKEFLQYLIEIDYHFIVTFNGLIYRDDKFVVNWKGRFWNFGRVLRDCWRDKKINFKLFKEVLIDKNKTLPERLEVSLEGIKRFLQSQGIDKVEWIYLTRIDSDDMFHKLVIQELSTLEPFEGALIFRNGLLYNINTGQLARWEPTTNPPFHTIMFPAKIFFDVEKHLAYMKDFKTHEEIPRIFRTKQLPNGRYCVGVHSKHISTIWNHPFRGKEFDQKDIKSIMVNFIG